MMKPLNRLESAGASPDQFSLLCHIHILTKMTVYGKAQHYM